MPFLLHMADERNLGQFGKINSCKNGAEKKVDENVSHLNRRVKTGLNIVLRTVEAIYHHLDVT